MPSDSPLKCFVKTPLDAALLILSPDILKPCLQRLDINQRKSITNGSVFVFSEDSGLKRWTDGLEWSKSRIDNHFLVYQEICEIEIASNLGSLPSPVEDEVRPRTVIEQKK
jgi:Gti1/Pac2 family transcription factor